MATFSSPLNFFLWCYMKRNQMPDIASQHQTSHYCGWRWKGHGFKISRVEQLSRPSGSRFFQFFKQMLGLQNKPQPVPFTSFAVYYS
jgi:hypothetical protein